MRGCLLIATMMLGTGLSACTQAPPAPTVSDSPAGIAPLAQARIQMREVAEDARRPGVTLLKDRDGNALPLIEPAFITTADIASVALGSEATTGHGTLILRFTDTAAPRILAATEARVAKRVAFTVGRSSMSPSSPAPSRSPCRCPGWTAPRKRTGCTGRSPARRLERPASGKPPQRKCASICSSDLPLVSGSQNAATRKNTKVHAAQNTNMLA